MSDLQLHKGSRRHDYLDLFRGMMILCMILNHCAKYFWLNTEQNWYLLFLLWLDFFIAANFLLISGLAYNYYFRSRTSTIRKAPFLKETVLRAALIYGIATLMSVLFGKIGGLDDSWSHWSIFKVIGVGIIVIVILDALPHFEVSLTLVMVGFFILGYLSTVVDNGVLAFFSKGAFAFFPWFDFFGAGFLVGRRFHKPDETGFEFGRWRQLLFPALILIVLSALPLVRYNLNAYIEWNMKLFLGNAGLFVWYLVTFDYLVRKAMPPAVKWLIAQIKEYGRISFSLYYLHFGLIYLVMLMNMGLYGGNLFASMNGWLFTGIVLLLLIVLNIGCSAWKQHHYVIGMEWIISTILEKSIRK